MKKILLITFSIFSLLGNAQNWSPLGSGTNTWANQMPMAVYNGELYVGGSFTKAGGVQASCIAKWNGSTWSAVGNGVNNGGTTNYCDISAIAVYNGELYVAGTFTVAGSYSALNLAKWNGSMWLPVGSGLNLGSNSYIWAMTVYNNQLIIAGGFDSVNGISANNIATWNGTTWSALGSGITNGNVWSLCAYDSILYAGGQYDSISGKPYNSIAQWNGSTWSPLGTGVTNTNSYGYISTMCIYNKNLYAFGEFIYCGGIPAYGMGYWTGSTWSTVGLNNTAVQYIDAYCSLSAGGKIYVAGLINTINGGPANNILTWDGFKWDTVGSGLSADSNVSNLCLYNNAVYATGHFTNSGTTLTDHIAMWDLLTGINPITSQNGFIKVSPNPSSGIYNFELGITNYESKGYTLEIYNVLGQKAIPSFLILNS